MPRESAPRHEGEGGAEASVNMTMLIGLCQALAESLRAGFGRSPKSLRTEPSGTRTTCGRPRGANQSLDWSGDLERRRARGAASNPTGHTCHPGALPGSCSPGPPRSATPSRCSLAS